MTEKFAEVIALWKQKLVDRLIFDTEEASTPVAQSVAEGV